jgi:hypothetical protein
MPIVGFSQDYSQNFRQPAPRRTRGVSKQQAFAVLV